jgi:hypothetical protein
VRADGLGEVCLRFVRRWSREEFWRTDLAEFLGINKGVKSAPCSPLPSPFHERFYTQSREVGESRVSIARITDFTTSVEQHC